MWQRIRNAFKVVPQVLPSLAAYEQWAATYPPQAHNALMQAEEAAMLALLPDVRGQVIVDVACGTGRYGLIAQQRGAARVIGTDNSAAMLLANPCAGRVLATSEALPLANGCADGVICGLALGHLPRLEPSLREIGRVLKAGGWALVSDVHPFLFLNGAQRTFTGANGRVYAVEHYPHLYADYLAAARAAGLHLEDVREPRIAQVHAPVAIIYLLRQTGATS